MKLLSIDLETTGQDSTEDQVLEVALVVEDTSNPLATTELPYFLGMVRRNRIQGSLGALAMNADLLRALDNPKPRYATIMGDPTRVLLEMWGFLKKQGFGSGNPATLLGKNVDRFDRPFLESFIQEGVRRGSPDEANMIQAIRPTIARRGVDPSIYFLNFDADSGVPDTTTCETRAGLMPLEEHTRHRALPGAYRHVELFREGLKLADGSSE